MKEDLKRLRVGRQHEEFSLPTVERLGGCRDQQGQAGEKWDRE